MKKLVFLLLLATLTSSYSHAQNKADDIIGYYFLVDPFTGEESQIYIYKTASGKYDGKVVWVGNVKKKSFLNYVFLENLVFNPDEQEWEDGIIKYAGKSGVYRTYMSFVSKNKIKVRGYWGVSWLGKTLYWTKESSRRVQK